MRSGPRRIHRAGSVIASVALPLLASAALAGTSQGSFTVTASVAAVCQMSASALNFPNYLPGSGAVLHATATISIQCSTGTNNPTLALNAGSSGGTMANRLMLGPGGNHLQWDPLESTCRHASLSIL